MVKRPGRCPAFSLPGGGAPQADAALTSHEKGEADMTTVLFIHSAGGVDHAAAAAAPAVIEAVAALAESQVWPVRNIRALITLRRGTAVLAPR